MRRSIPMRPIEGSSAIHSAGYDPATRSLHLQFHGAKEASVIEDVDEGTYRDFLAAKSKGRFFHERLK